MELIKQGWAVIRRNAQAILAVCAFGVSLCALYISVVEIRNNQEFQRISVWPRLWVVKSSHFEYFRIEVRNQGLGPAVIRSVHMTLDGKPVNRWTELKEMLGVPDSSTSHASLSTRVLEAGGKVIMLEIRDAKGREALNQAWSEGRLVLEISYASVYGECWLVSSETGIIETESCPEEKSIGSL